ncbi:MAG TPA: wax ester/triacylglycerol synthase domain-containing protein [Solirubrobacteraceae bacterium]|nr:wax ester/triacylglycerol synthase domain-containing protein [Solirubrobacteraceae bacterium]
MSTRDDGPLDWGSSDEMNALEVLMWRAEDDPELRSTILLLNVFDRAPDWPRLHAAHEWGSRMVPRFRKRVAETPLRLGAPYWTLDEDFDLAYHVRRIAVPEPHSWSAALGLVEQIAMTPFDRARPPWEAYLLEGLSDGRAGYVLKMHHSIMDGMAGAQLFGELYSRTREPNPDKAQPAPPRDLGPSGTEALIRQVGRDTLGAAGLARDLTGRLARSAGRPVGAVSEASRYVASLRRVLAPPDCEPSPLLRARSMSSRIVALDFALADFRAAGKAVGATVNDAFVAAQLGGFRRYHEHFGCPIERMPISMPISVRREADQRGGNRFAGASFAAPVGIVDPGERMRAFGAMVREARAEPAIDGIGFVSPALARLPGPVVAAFTGALTKSNDLQTSSVPFIRDEVFMAGAKIERSFPIGPLPGCAVMGAMITHGDRCCVGMNLDPAAVTDVELFGRCLEEGFSEVLALYPQAEPLARLS